MRKFFPLCLLLVMLLAVVTHAEEEGVTIFKISLNMPTQQILQTIGKPTFKAKKNTNWHYRKLNSKVPEWQSDPIIVVREDKAKVIMGTNLEKGGTLVLCAKDPASKIEEVLGKCPNISAGARENIRLYTYSNWHLQVVTMNDKVLAMSLNEEF
ncbi:hypothetical protein IJT10_08695 [bacterium]|nr:hypothetical protein [bacterium]